MCGIAGIVNFTLKPLDLQTLVSVSRKIKHRGPDDEGYLLVNTNSKNILAVGGEDTPKELYQENFVYAPKISINEIKLQGSFNLALINRRLSIQDISVKGHQPMSNEDGSIWITYNGEIYNFKELKEILLKKGHKFISASDTEVIIHSYEEWGINCLQKFNGMFSFAILDLNNGIIFCARDRLGEKPFYYYYDTNLFLFSSEIKGILEFGIQPIPNETKIYYYLKNYNHIPFNTHETYFKNIYSLKGGEFLIINLNDKTIRISPYWNLKENVPTNTNENEIISNLRNLLIDSCEMRLISDVPTSTCLSGGLDSSTIVLLIEKIIKKKRKVAKYPRKTFSAVYKDKKYDESYYIDIILKQTGLENERYMPTFEDFKKDFKKIIYHVEEPCMSSAGIIAQYCIYKKINNHSIKVVLDGQGGDELLGGYPWEFYPAYMRELFYSLKWLRFCKELPYYIRTIFGRITVRKFLNALLTILPNSLSFLISKIFSRKSFNVDRLLISNKLNYKVNTFISDLKTATYLSLRYTYLPELLKIADKISMAHSVEARYPFLDYRLVEFLYSLPSEYKIQKGITKYILRKAFADILPPEILTRGKQGFYSVPFENLKDENIRKIIIEEILNSDIYKLKVINWEEIKKLLIHFNENYSSEIAPFI
jgi:asparagine synthase (glutamine-hydrolysing)